MRRAYKIPLVFVLTVASLTVACGQREHGAGDQLAKTDSLTKEQTSTPSNVVLSCTFRSNGKDAYVMTESASDKTSYTMTEVSPPPSYRARNQGDFRLIGRANLGWKNLNFGGPDPLTTFVQVPNHDSSTFRMAPNPNSKGVFESSLSLNRVGVDLNCTPGPLYPSLAMKIQSVPLIDRLIYTKLTDARLALDCSALGSTETKYLIRAFRYGAFWNYAEITLSVVPADSDLFRTKAEFKGFTYGKGNDLVFKKDGYSYGKYSDPRLYISAQVQQGAGGDQYRAATFVPDLKKPELGIENLVCREMSAYSLVGGFLNDINDLPKALPSKPGTVSEIDKSLCVDESQKEYADARHRVARWGKFIYDHSLALLPRGERIDGTNSFFDKVTKCQGLEVYIRAQQDFDDAKSVIGDSIDGIEVRYTRPTKKGGAL